MNMTLKQVEIVRKKLPNVWLGKNYIWIAF